MKGYDFRDYKDDIRTVIEESNVGAVNKWHLESVHKGSVIIKWDYCDVQFLIEVKGDDDCMWMAAYCDYGYTGQFHQDYDDKFELLLIGDSRYDDAPVRFAAWASVKAVVEKANHVF